MSISDILEIVKIIVCFFFLVFSSLQDYRDRRVSNAIFKFFIPIATILTAVEIGLSSSPLTQLANFAIHAAVSIAIFFVIYYVGFFGGADAKALISLSIAMPWPPTIVTPLVELNFPVFPISIFNDAILLSVLTLPYALFSNFNWKMGKRRRLFEGLEKESTLKKIGALIFCVKMEKVRVKPYHMVAEDHGKIILLKRIQEEDLSPKELEELPTNIFIIFSLPMLIFITIGFISTIFFGDLIIFLIRTLLGI